MSDMTDAQTRALAADEIEAVAGAVIAIIQPQCRPMESLNHGRNRHRLVSSVAVHRTALMPPAGLMAWLSRLWITAPERGCRMTVQANGQPQLLSASALSTSRV
jgi:hypothetical protein